MTSLSIQLDSTGKAPLEARRAIRACFGDSLAAPVVHDLCVIASELVTNSVQHGPGEPVQVRIACGDDGVVRGEVEDQGEGEVALREVLEGRGLGLRIVDALAARWGVYPGSTHVWFELA